MKTTTHSDQAVRDKPVALSLHSRCGTHRRTPRTRCPVSGRRSSVTYSGCTWLVCWTTWRRSGDVGAGCVPATSSEPCAIQNPVWHSSVPADVSRVTYTVKTQKTKTPMLKYTRYKPKPQEVYVHVTLDDHMYFTKEVKFCFSEVWICNLSTSFKPIVKRIKERYKCLSFIYIWSQWEMTLPPIEESACILNIQPWTAFLKYETLQLATMWDLLQLLDKMTGYSFGGNFVTQHERKYKIKGVK